MPIDPTLQHAHGSGAWVKNLTPEELRYHIDGNMFGSAIHGMCQAELDRREADQQRRAEMMWIKRTFWATIALGVIGLVATLAKG